ncbi:MAG: RelA/SpoT domain-containing protein [Proteobacteria bacterium]|nr:RelA/SpoT domain-containing protein [Pseudomonadota bacterium]
MRQLLKAKEKGQAFPITEENLFVEINDLAGIRILHLHTHQIAKIDSALKEIIDEQSLELIEGPTARTWDNEYRDYFKSVGIETQESPTMYTSVHYIIKSKSKTVVTCEIQVRTLMEEVWGEVDHMINYPHPIESVACVEQIRALARATSAATRLVDSIFATFADFECQEKKVTTRRRRAKSKQPSSRKTK